MLNGYLTRQAWPIGLLSLALLLTLAALVALLPPSPAVEAQSVPATPSSVTLTRADGTVTASWPAVSGATKYHVTYTTDNGDSWHAPVDNHTDWQTNSITFNADNAKTYIVGVRAGNDHGWSGWRNSPSAGPYQPDPTPTPTPSPTPAPNPPGPVASVTVTRTDGALAASWPAVSGATHYHVTYTVIGSGNWLLAALNHTESSIDIRGVDNDERYVVGVRAGNADGWSGWVNSPGTPAYKPPKGVSPPPAPASVTITRSDGSLTATWPAVSEATGYHVGHSKDLGETWQRVVTDHTETSVTFSVRNSLTYIVCVMSVNDDGESEWRDSPPAGPYTPPPAAPTRLTATAGDQSVTLAWNDPANSSITGYEYQYRYAGVAWSSWTDVADSDADTTAHTVTGLTNGTEYRFKLRAVNAGGQSGAAPAAAPWYVAATPAAPEPPTAPTSVTVTRTDGAITASWPAVSGANGYTVTYSAVGNGNWTTAASNQSATSITIAGVNNDHTYLVGASASNAAGSSASSVSPPAGPYSQQPPAAPPSVTILRADKELTAFWNSGYGAESYHVTYSSNNGKTWSLAAERVPVGNGTTQITIKNLDNSKHYTVGVRARNKNGYSGWRNSSPSGPYVPIAAPPKPKNPQLYTGNKSAVFIWEKPEWHKPVKPGGVEVTGYQAAYWLNPGDCAWPAEVKWYNIIGSNGDTVYHTVVGHHIENGQLKPGLKNGAKYGVALRALNQHVPGTGVAGCLTPSASASPPPIVPPAPKNMNLIRGDGTLTVTWHHARTASGYQVDYSTNGGQTWAMAVWWNNTTSTTLHGMDNNATYTVRVRGRNNRGDGPWSDSVTDTPPPNLSAVNIGATTATLTLSHYSGGAWYYKANAGPDSNSCKGPVSSGTTTKIVSALTKGTPYTYTAYSDSGCATEIDAASFTTLTPNLAVNNIARTSATLTLTGWTAGSGAGKDGVWYYQRYTSGGGTNPLLNPCSTAQSAATADLTGLTVNTDYAYKAYTDSGCGTELAAADEFYTGDTVSNLGETQKSSGKLGQVGDNNIKRAAGFTTGSNSHGYALEKVTAKFDAKVGSPTGFTAAIHAESASSQGNPAGNATCALTGSAPNTAGEFVYTASSCSLSASTNYFLVLSTVGTTGQNHYSQWGLTDSASQTNTPSNAGWTFADRGKVKTGSGNWSTEATALVPLFEVKAVVKPEPTPGGRDSSQDFDTLDAAGNDRPKGIWSDGTTMWVVDQTDRKLYAYNLATKARDAAKDIALDATKSGWRYPTSDGTTLWLSESNTWYKIYAYDLSGGTRDSGKDLTVNPADRAIGLWTNGTTMYVLNNTDKKFYAYTIAGGARDTSKEFTLHADNGLPRGAWSDGTTMWVLDDGDLKVYAYKLSDGTRDSAKDYTNLTSLANSASSYGIWSDGTTMWISDNTKLHAYHAMSPGAKLTVIAVASTTATLYLGAHVGNWHYQANTGPDSACSSTAQTGTTLSLSGLTAGTEYTYKAYDKSGCNSADEIASVTFTTAVSVGNLTETGTGNLTIGRHTANTYVEKWATAFTTGSNTGGYTVQSVIAKFGAKNGSPGNITAKIYADSSGVPGTAVANLTLTGPTGPSSEDATYACSGTGCSLSASTTYHLAFEVAGSPAAGVNYQWRAVTSDNETNAPSNAGWTIANGSSQWKSDTSSWTANANVYSALFEVTATTN